MSGLFFDVYYVCIKSINPNGVTVDELLTFYNSFELCSSWKYVGFLNKWAIKN